MRQFTRFARGFGRSALVAALLVHSLADGASRAAADLIPVPSFIFDQDIQTQARAQAFGGTVDPHGYSQTNYDVYGAYAGGVGTVNGAFYYSEGFAFYEPISRLPWLKAAAIAFAPRDPAYWIWRTRAVADLSFYDKLRVVIVTTQDPVISGLLPLVVRASLSPHLHGEATGDVKVNFDVWLSGSESESTFRYEKRIWDHTNPSQRDLTNSETATGPLPVSAVSRFQYYRDEATGLYWVVSAPIHMSIDLQLDARSWTTFAMGSANYLSTATISPIKITDVDGNYIPGSENWRIIGDSGLEYAMHDFTPQAIPEPTTLMLLGTGLVAVVIRRRIRKRAS